MENKKEFDVMSYIANQMQKDDETISKQIEVEKVKIGWTKQYNNAIKNAIDHERVEIKKQELGMIFTSGVVQE